MSYSIIKNNNAVSVIDQDTVPLYKLDKESMHQLTSIDGSTCSACILQLAATSVLPNNILYEIAFFIQKNYAYLYIDWFTTFYHVEKASYINTAYEMKMLLEGKETGLEMRNKIDELAAFEENELVDDVDTAILKIVMMNIINFNVIIR